MSIIKNLLQSGVNEAYWAFQRVKLDQTRFLLEKQKMDAMRRGIYEGNVILLDEFVLKALKPLAQNFNPVAKKYGAQGEKFQYFWEENTNFLYSVDEIKDNDFKQFIIQRVNDDAEKEISENLRFQKEMGMVVDDPNFKSSDYLQLLKEYHLEYERLTGVSILEIGEFLHSTGFEALEDKAIKEGRGALLTDFWQAVSRIQPQDRIDFDENDNNKKDDHRLDQDKPSLIFAPAGLTR